MNIWGKQFLKKKQQDRVPQGESVSNIIDKVTVGINFFEL